MVSSLAWVLLAGAVCTTAPVGDDNVVGAALDRRSSTLLECDFTGASPGVNTPWTETRVQRADLDFSGWAGGPGTIGVSAVDDAFGYYIIAESEVSTLAEAVADEEYISCTVSGSSQAPLDLSYTRISFSIERLSWHAPRRYAVFTSATGFAPGDEVFTTAAVENADLSERDWSFFLPAMNFEAVEAIEFRIYAFDARYASHETSLKTFGIHAGLPTRTLSLRATEGGRATANPEGTRFSRGDTILLTATPDEGYRFAGWSGMVNGLGNPRPLRMTQNYEVIANFEPVPATSMTVATNLGAVVDWSTAWSHLDLQKRMRAWRTRAVGGDGPSSTGFGSEVPVDEQGWPTQVPFTASDESSQFVHTTLRAANEAGSYIMFYEGSGELVLKHTGGSTTYLPTGGQRSHVFHLPEGGSLWYEIHETDPDDPLRNIRIVLVGQGDIAEGQEFHPLYLSRLAPFSALRFMDWGRTNGSPLREWSDRTRPDHYTQARDQGASLEAMIALANTSGKDAWICIPHAATNDYVRRAARLIRDTLDPALKVWVEYSNETWNSAGAFTQTDYVQDRGEELGLAEDRWHAGQRYVALRSSEVWRLFELEFGRAEVHRLVKVLATQSARPALTRMRLEALGDLHINANYSYPDVLAVAPYFGHSFEPEDLPPHTDAYPSVSALVGPIAAESISALREEVREHKAIANEQGLQLVCYEGGQHYVGKRGAENDLELTEILQRVNRDPRMYERYIEYLDMLEEEGVELFCNYTFCREWNKWGSWGTLESMDQDPASAPKYRALVDWVAAR